MALKNIYLEFLAREKTLNLYGFAMLILMVPTLIAMGLDDRVIRGVGVWDKPLKFMASTALFSLSAAWFVGLLPVKQRSSWQTIWVVWLLIATSLFEVAYISFQGAIGQASPYNNSDTFQQRYLSSPHVWFDGDCCGWTDRISSMVGMAYRSPRCAAIFNMDVGSHSRIDPYLRSWYGKWFHAWCNPTARRRWSAPLRVASRRSRR